MKIKLLKEKLNKYKKEDIIITPHAMKQAIVRQIDLEEIKENIVNPERLVFAEQQEAKNKNEEKYNYYFGYSKTQCHRYVIAISKNIVVCTVIKINRRWQHEVEKHERV